MAICAVEYVGEFAGLHVYLGEDCVNGGPTIMLQFPTFFPESELGCGDPHAPHCVPDEETIAGATTSNMSLQSEPKWRDGIRQLHETVAYDEQQRAYRLFLLSRRAEDVDRIIALGIPLHDNEETVNSESVDNRPNTIVMGRSAQLDGVSYQLPAN